MAILPANVLIEDSTSKWLGAAAPIILEQDLSPAREAVPFLADSESAALQGGAAEVLRMTLHVHQARLQLTATSTDGATQQNRRVLTLEAPSVNAIVPLMNELAKRLDAHATVFPTQNIRAVQWFAQAMQTQDARTRVELLHQCLNADPDFGLAYIALLNATASAGQQAIAPILEEAQARSASFTPLDRARFTALRLRVLHAPMAQQMRVVEAVLEVAPNDVAELTALASARYLEGNARGGDQLIERALGISPGNVHVRQQYAQGLIETRRFREAEKVLLEIDANPGVQAQLSFCVLLEGDRSRANSLFDQFLASVPNPDLRTLFHASWLAHAGDTRNAIRAVQEGQFQNRGVRSLALSEAALWAAAAGDFPTARNAAVAAQQAGTSEFSSLAGLLSERPQTPAAWLKRVNRVPAAGNDMHSNEIHAAYGYFLFGYYSDAVQAWQELLNRSGGADLAARAMLAASLERVGRVEAASRVRLQPFVPDLANFYGAIPFSQMRALLH
ncbi:MAG: hypothetical protein JOY54_07685 [Acidobacteriaceae bacterium]|nr:hypothetical protein [Acidobacteriaceae bacterium]